MNARSAVVPDEAREAFTYDEAFGRNRGLISDREQARLRGATVAIAGVGGVGGGHALTLARQGVGGFRLADPDRFSVANLNRQAGATISSLGRNKARELGRLILEINPSARVELFEEGLHAGNVEAFLGGVDLVLDGLDAFAIDARRLLFASARERGLWTLTSGPLGFSATLHAFSPTGMSFDRYCGFLPGMSHAEQLIAFVVAIAPRATHLPYMDLSRVDVRTGVGPSAALACQLCSAVIATEALALLLGRRAPRAAPDFSQLDPYRGVYRRGRLRWGNRGPLQRLKRWALRRRLARLGVI